MKRMLKLFLLFFLAGLALKANAQELKFSINMAQMSSGSLDLLALIKDQAGAATNISSVRVLARSSLGGASIYLQVNGQMMDMAAVNTDPAFFGKEDGSYVSYELQNYENVVTKALLLSKEISSLEIKEVVVILGAIGPAKILGTYTLLPMAQAIPSPNPTDQTSAIPSPGKLASETDVVTPIPPVTPPPPVVPQCFNDGARKFCVGQRVSTPWGQGIVSSVPASGNFRLILRMDAGQSYAIDDAHMPYIH